MVLFGSVLDQFVSGFCKEKKRRRCIMCFQLSKYYIGSSRICTGKFSGVEMPAKSSIHVVMIKASLVEVEDTMKL